MPAYLVKVLKDKQNIQTLSNVGYNLVSVTLTVVSMGEGVAAVRAVTAATSATRGVVFTKHFMTLADLGYTIADTTAKITGTEMPEWWQGIGTLFAVDGAMKFTVSSAEALAKLRKDTSQEKLNIIQDLEIKKDNKALDVDELDEIASELETELIKNGTDEQIAKYRAELDTAGAKNLDDLDDAHTILKNNNRVLDELENLKCK